MSNTKKLSEKFRAKHPKLFILIILIICFVSPYALFNLVICIFKIISNLSIGEPDFLILTNNYKFDIKDYANFFFLLMQVVVTGFFSYFLWETALKSNKLSEQIKEKEDKKEENTLRENALIVYYDLRLGINDLVKLYDAKIKKSKITAPKRLYFSSDWIKNTAVLAEFLSYDDLNSIYTLYGDLHTIKELLEDDSCDLNDEIQRVFEKVISENVIDYVGVINLSNFDKIESILNTYYLCIFEKLKLLILNKNEFEVVKIEDYTFSILSSNKTVIYYLGNMEKNVYSGKGNLSDEYGRERLEGIFENGIFKNGLRKEYYSNGELFYEIRYQNGKRVEGIINSEEKGVKYASGKFEDSVLYEGYLKKYKDNGDLLYEGEMLAGRYNGEGTLYYDNKHKMQGIWTLGKFIEGIEYNVRINDSDGYNYDAEQSWIEEQIEKNNDEEYLKQQQEGFEQTASGWTEFANIEWKDGKGTFIKGTNRVEYKY